MLKRIVVILSILMGITSQQARAQWVDEVYSLRPGWNAIWLSHDTSWATIDELLVAHPNVIEVWQWNTLSSTSTFTDNPVSVVQSDTQWFVWKRGFPTASTMTRLSGNTACLVRVSDSASAFQLSLKGRPEAPNCVWASSGTNLLGFPMKTPDDFFTRNFNTLLSLNTDFTSIPDIYKYDGGAIETNPKKVTSVLFEPVTRGRAYWIDSNTYSEFYGPLKVSAGTQGLAYGTTGVAQTLRIKNVTANTLTATIQLASSATPPSGHDPVAGNVSLKIRGAFNPQSGGFSYSDFNGTESYSLASGEEIEVVIAVDRVAMIGTSGDVFQSILQITDSLDITRIDLPVSAEITNYSGLWVGSVEVKSVDQITAAPAPVGDGTSTVSVSTQADAVVPSSFNIRLILHRDDAGNVSLLQRVFMGPDNDDVVILTTDEASLNPAKLSLARRISSANFAPNTKLTGSSDIGLTSSIDFSHVLPYTDASNPFVHTYHPDHDNRDAQYGVTPLADGDESYTVSRAINFSFVADPASIGVSDSLGWGSSYLGGNYSETISGIRAQPINVKGTFVLQKINTINVLTP